MCHQKNLNQSPDQYANLFPGDFDHFDFAFLKCEWVLEKSKKKNEAYDKFWINIVKF